MIDTQSIISALDLRTEVETHLGPPKTRARNYSQWPCIFHNDGKTPSMTVYQDHLYCFGCGAYKDAIDWTQYTHNCNFKEACQILAGNTPRITPQELNQITQQRQEQHRRLALEARQRAEDWLKKADCHERYAQALAEHREGQEWLQERGIGYQWAEHFGLGVREDTPWGGDAVSIPWPHPQQPVDLQYRLIHGQGNGRYRWEPEIQGHTKTLFNGQILRDSPGPLVLVEGAFKAMTLCASGLNALAIENKTGWEASWTNYLRGKDGYVCLDPDAEAEAEAVARDTGWRVIDLPMKPDDMQLEYHLSPDDWHYLMRQARAVA